MSELKSNMPELEWHPDGDGGFSAYPNGREHAGQYAWVGQADITRPQGGARYPWGVTWEGRFRGVHGSPSVLDAKQAATNAWWLAIEETENWRPGDRETRVLGGYDPYAGVDWERAAALSREFQAEMKRRHEQLLATRAEARKIARATAQGKIGMIGPPDPRQGRIWKPKT